MDFNQAVFHRKKLNSAMIFYLLDETIFMVRHSKTLLIQVKMMKNYVQLKRWLLGGKVTFVYKLRTRKELAVNFDAPKEHSGENSVISY